MFAGAARLLFHSYIGGAKLAEVKRPLPYRTESWPPNRRMRIVFGSWNFLCGANVNYRWDQGPPGRVLVPAPSLSPGL